MSFYMPLGLIGLLAVPILILLYVLKRRYREEIVPSTFLWKRSLKYMKKRFPWSLRNSLLLLLQILVIVLLSFALARPYVVARNTGEVIAIVDASASMMSVDSTGETRFERAIKNVNDLAEDAGPNRRVTVILAADTARQYIYRSAEPEDIKKAIADCKCTYATPDIEGALALAATAQEQNSEARIAFYTDATYELSEGIEIVNVTNKERNAAALDLQGKQVGGIWRFEGTIAAYGADMTVTASLYVDGNYVSVRNVNCFDGEETKVEFRDYEATGYRVAQMILSVENASDALTTDNTISLFNTSRANKLVQIVFGPGSRDLFLESALRAISGVNVSSISINGLDENGYEEHAEGQTTADSSIRYTGYDLYVFVGIKPEILPDDGALWLINPPSILSEDGVTVIPAPMPEGISASFGYTNEADADRYYTMSSNIGAPEPYDAVVAGLSLQNVAVKRYTQILSETYTSLLYTDRDTLLAAGKEGHQRVMIMTISLSDLSTNMADYVILIGNMFAYSCPLTIDSNRYYIGETAELIMPPSATQLSITRDTSTINVKAAEDTSFHFDTPGNYEFKITLEQTGTGILVTKTQIYNCFVGISNSDSDIFAYEDSIAALPLSEEATPQLEAIEIWLYLLIALLVVLTAEWWVYYLV